MQYLEEVLQKIQRPLSTKDLEGKGKAELRELDISNLGILIRESVEKYLANAELVITSPNA
ncbi:MAG: hypothetical protein MUF77_14305 [Leptospira sp.]|nr:hypothetical protein [Leptospira sp.]